MSNALNGNSRGTAYKGTGARTPPNTTIHHLRPAPYNVQNVQVGDYWIYDDPTPGSNYQELYYLASKKGNINSAGEVALWVLIDKGASGTVESLTTDDATVVLPDLGNIFLAGGLNIFTDGVNDHAIVNLKTSILQPFTTADGSSGVYALGTTNNATDRFMYSYGSRNTFLGRQAGNLSLTVANATDNTAIGYQAGLALTRGNANTLLGSTAGTSVTTGDINVCIGAESALNLTTGSGNIAIGYQSLENALTGNGNVAIGFQAGNALVGAEQGNIYLSNDGVAAENTTIRIGNNLTHTAAYISGVYGQTVSSGSELPVVMDNTGKLGTSAGAGGPVLTTTNFGTMFSQPVFARVNTNNTCPSGTPYFLGTSGGLGNFPMTVDINVGGNFYPGDGMASPAQFTAPVTATYQIVFQLQASTTGGSAPIFLTIVTTTVGAPTYTVGQQLINTNLGSWINFSIYTNMNAADTAQFQLEIGGAGRTITIGGNTSVSIERIA